MRLVIIESPFAGDVVRNLRYLRACMRDCLRRGEAPYVSHALYTQPGVLDDTNASDRMLGMSAGFAWRDRVDATVVYTDLGRSPGMEAGVAHAASKGQAIEARSLGPDWEARALEVEATFRTRWP